MKKMFVLVMMMFMVIGFSNSAMACEGLNCAPTTVVNQGGSYMIQGPSMGIDGSAVIGGKLGWCGPSFGFVNVGGAYTEGHGMIGGTHNFVNVTPGKTHGITMNGNTYGQGWALGKGAAVNAGAWVNDVNIDGTTTHSVLKKNACGGTIVNKTITDTVHTHGYDFGTVAGGSLKGPGAFQGQSGMNYTKVKW